MLKNNCNVPCEICPSRNQSPFSSLSESDLGNISADKNCVFYKKGQHLFFEGTRPLGIFCIHSGAVKVYKTAANGKEHIIRLAKKGEFLGHNSLFGEEFHTVSASIIGDASICFIPKERLFQLLSKNPDFFKKILQLVCKEVGLLEQQLAVISQKSVRERLAYTLLFLKDSYAGSSANNTRIEIALTREDLANYIGTATETVIRLLSDFKSSGYIEFEGKKIRILNDKALVKESDFYKNAS
jgi:CRP-like cAMP-binding protein